jgi:radical SAM protein with 4Fe4S-binding SPASM domain
MEIHKISHKANDSNVFQRGWIDTRIDNIRILNISKPLFAQYEICDNCNQHCFFCYNVWREEKERLKPINKQKKIEVIKKIIELEVFGLIISGGEPLIVSYLEELINIANDAKIETTIITNGLLLSQERCKKLKKVGLKGIQISLHSCDEAEHDKITGVKGSFQKTITNIKHAIDIFGSDFININMVATKKTCGRIYETARFLRNMGVVNFSASSFSYSGLGKKVENITPNKSDFNILFNQILEAKKDFGISTLISGAFPLCALDMKIDKNVTEMLGNICDAGITQIVIGPNGDLRPCVSYNVKLGNILDDDAIRIWNENQFLKNLRQLEHVPDACSDCNYLIFCYGGCRASAYEYTGTLNGIHPLIIE